MNAGWGLWPRISWNPPDFTCEIWQISPVKSTQNYKSKCFSKNSSVWWMQGGGFCPRNLVDFTLKSGGFHPWNPVDFTQISPVKSTKIIKASVSAKTLQFDECRVGAMTKDFTHEIQWISPRFHLWNPPKIIKASVSAKNSSVWWMQGGGYDQGFHEIWWSLPRFHLWNPPKIIKASVSAKTLQFDECRVGAMTKDFMKSAWNLPDFMVKSAGFHEIHWISWIMSFCVMIKYRSFDFRKTSNIIISDSVM